MLKILCAAFLLCGFLQTEPSNRALYQQAAGKIAARDYRAAISSLETLSKRNDSELSGLAAVRLAELYVATGQSSVALGAINGWSASGFVESNLTPDQAAHLDEICFTIAVKQTTAKMQLTQLQDLEVRLLAQLASSTDASVSSVDSARSHSLIARTALALSRIHQSQQAFGPASQVLERAIEQLGTTASDSLTQQRERHLPLAAARFYFAQRQFSNCAETLAAIEAANLPMDEQVVLHFLLLESHLNLGNNAQATPHSSWLESSLEQQATKPGWAPTLLLRQAELALKQKEYLRLDQLVARAHDDYPAFASAHEFDFLAIRSAVARIEFNAAAVVLERLVQHHHKDSEPYARAHWMWGELELMRRNYPQALLHYRFASDQAKYPVWQSCALLQMAKCHEGQGNPELAIQYYQRACHVVGNPNAQQEAQTRLAALQAPEVQHR